jgi:hypothetical protein
MLKRNLLKTITTGAAFAAVLTVGMSLLPSPGRADNDNNGSQDEKQMIQTGLSVAGSIGIQLKTAGKDPDMVGLGSYLVNVTSDCNGCHSVPQTSFAAGGNPYLLPGSHPPFYSGVRQFNPATYLGGNQSFGSFGPGPKAEIISRNITPDWTGMPEGHTLSEFMRIFRTGVDLDGAHPSCTGAITNNCLSFPFNGAVLQVMPWPAFQNLTDRQITAIYTYLSTVPCLEGGPGEPFPRCTKK